MQLMLRLEGARISKLNVAARRRGDEVPLRASDLEQRTLSSDFADDGTDVTIERDDLLVRRRWRGAAYDDIG